MLFCVPESTAFKGGARYDNDVAQFSDVVNKLLLGTSESVTVERITRLDRRLTDFNITSCRPMKVLLGSVN